MVLNSILQNSSIAGYRNLLVASLEITVASWDHIQRTSPIEALSNTFWNKFTAPTHSDWHGQTWKYQFFRKMEHFWNQHHLQWGEPSLSDRVRPKIKIKWKAVFQDLFNVPKVKFIAPIHTDWHGRTWKYMYLLRLPLSKTGFILSCCCLSKLAN